MYNPEPMDVYVEHGENLFPMSVVLKEFFTRFHPQHDVASSSSTIETHFRLRPIETPTVAEIRRTVAMMDQRLNEVDVRLQRLVGL